MRCPATRVSVWAIFFVIGCTEVTTAPKADPRRLLTQAVEATSLPLSLTVIDPVGDQTGPVDVVRMEMSFDNTTGQYAIVISADAAHPFLGQFRVNINLFDPDVGTTDPIPSFFEDVHSDFDLSSPLTALTFTGTDPNLLAWAAGHRVFTNSLAGTGNPDGVTLYRTAVSSVPFAFLTNEDVVAFAALDQPAIIQPPATGNRAPVGSVAGPSTGAEGSALMFDATGSTDPDGDPLLFTWDFGDGAQGSGPTPTHTYADNGSYTVTVIAVDPGGLTATATTTVTIQNIAPAIDAPPSTTLIAGEGYSASGDFTDPGADAWSGTVDYDDGAGVRSLPLQGKEFSLAHLYVAPGAYVITISVADDDGGIGVGTTSVTVKTPREAIQDLIDLVLNLPHSGGFGGLGWFGRVNVLKAVEDYLDKGNVGAALSKLNAFVHMIEALRNSRHLAPDVAAELIDLAQRIARALSQPLAGPT